MPPTVNIATLCPVSRAKRLACAPAPSTRRYAQPALSARGQQLCVGIRYSSSNISWTHHGATSSGIQHTKDNNAGAKHALGGLRSRNSTIVMCIVTENLSSADNGVLLALATRNKSGTNEQDECNETQGALPDQDTSQIQQDNHHGQQSCV